jgi:MFS family permease
LAALGATTFSFAASSWQLMAGRLLIGVGMAAGLVAGLKTIAISFPKDRVAVLNGSFIALGTLGAVAATAPAEWLLALLGWRGLFQIFACALLLIALAFLLLVPALPQSASSQSAHAATLSYGTLFRDPQFCRLALLSGLSVGSAWALQGLWAAQWMSDVVGMDRAALVTCLFVMSLVLSAGALGLGAAIGFLKRWGVGPSKILAGMVLLLMAAEFLLTARHLVPLVIPWCLVAFMSAGTVATYSITAAAFDGSSLGRVNGAINLFHIGGAFLVQSAVGFILSRWEAPATGHYPAQAYTVMFVVLISGQAAALTWYLRPAKSGSAPVAPSAEPLRT